MPFKNVVAGYNGRSAVHKTLKFHTLTRNEKLKRKWIKEISLRRKNFKWRTSNGFAVLTSRKDGSKHLTIFPVFSPMKLFGQLISLTCWKFRTWRLEKLSKKRSKTNSGLLRKISA